VHSRMRNWCGNRESLLVSDGDDIQIWGALSLFAMQAFALESRAAAKARDLCGVVKCI